MKKVLLTILTLFLSATMNFAQDTTGRIIGSVSAPDGVIPGATIVVRDNQTGREQTVTASGEGSFTVPQLEFGTYTVTITATGYKIFVVNEVKIDAGREYPLNAQLELGQITEQVTITAGAEQINATNAELSNTISSQQLRELPLNGRSALGLIRLQAGANSTTSSINGQRSSSTTITRDGLNVQDNFIRTGAFVPDSPTVDDVSEITVTTQNAGVEQGGGSSMVQLITPRGGQDFHGALYIFNRNSEFAANSFFNNSRIPVATPKAFLNRNEFGGTISGPMPIPNFGEGGPVFLRNKAFFFFNYEGLRLAQQTAAVATTLLPQARNGDFTYTPVATASNPNPTPITVNVLTGAGFNLTGANQTSFNNAGGVLTVDPIIQSRLLNNLPTTANGIITGTNYLQDVNFNRSNGGRRNAYSSRFDFNVNDRNSFNFVYKYNFDDNQRADIAGSAFSTTPFVTQGGPTKFFVGAYRTTIGNNFSNEVRAGFQDSRPFFNESNIPTDYIIVGTPFTNPEGSFRAQGRSTFYRNIQDNAVYTIGNHSLRFGGQVEFYDVTSSNLVGTTPTLSISSTANPSTPGLLTALLPGINATDLARANALRYTLGGIIGGANQQANFISTSQGYGFGPSIDRYNFEIYSGYISDQWRVRPNLTLNLGLRYEFYTPLSTPNPKYLEPVIANADDIIGSLSNPNAVFNIVGQNSGNPGEYFKADKDNFAPSVSFAYSPNFDKGFFAGLLGGGTVLRGGFRVNYINDEYIKAASTLVASNPGLGSVLSVARNSAGLTTLRSTLTPRPGFESIPTFTTPTPRSLPILLSTSNAEGGNTRTAFGVDPNYQVQRNYEYNIGIQRNIGFNTVLEVRYVGGRSDTAARSNDFNQVDIQSNGFLADFQRAQNNCRLQGASINPTAPNPLFVCTSAAFNAAITGSQQLPVFNQLGGQGNLTNTANLGFIRNGTVASLAREYIRLRQQGTVAFQPTSNAYAVEILVNGGKYRYDALQAEIRRRFQNGVSYQVNYTFQKTLTDVLSDVGPDQNRQGTFLDNNNPGLNYGRADYDRTHTVNANFVLELPFGSGKRFLNQGGITNLIFGGFQFSSIISLSSGPPLGIIDPRATFNTRGFAGQSARTTLTTKEIKKLTGNFNTPNGIFFINPSVLFATATAPGRPTLTGIDLNQPLPAGYTLASVRATSTIDQAPFAGQVFFFNNAGETGNLPINFINGMPYLNWNASLSKNIRFTESARLQLRMDAFNVLNKQVPFFGADLDINSNFFGRVTSTYNGSRVLQFGARFDF
jgi:hypothetical protein